MYTNTIPQPRDQMISIIQGVDVIHSILHLIWSDENRNTPFINGVKMLEVLLGFNDNVNLEIT
jgi:hypothetical protein